MKTFTIFTMILALGIAGSIFAGVGDIGCTTVFPGDVDGDKLITRADALAVREAAAGRSDLEAPDPVYDYNNDGQLTIADAVAMSDDLAASGVFGAVPREHCFLRGDGNGDGKITVKDGQMIIDYFLGRLDIVPNTEAAFDVNADGQFTLADVQELLDAL